MTDRRPLQRPLPHHHLVAYHVAVELLRAVERANIRDAKRRAFAIARGEAVEAVAAVEIAAAAGDADEVAAAECVPIADRRVALLTGLLR